MAIALDNADAGSSQTGTSLSFSHTCTGTNLILFVGIRITAGSTNDITGVTYNNVAMTQVASVQEPTNGPWTYLYYLAGPATGANNVVVNSTSSTTKIMYGVSYTGAAQTGIPDAFTTATTNNNTIAGTVTTIANNCWVTGHVGAVGIGLTAGANTTLRGTASSFSKMWDSNGPVTPAGSFSLNASTSSGTPGFGVITASFAPFVPPPVVSGQSMGLSSVSSLSMLGLNTILST